MSKIRIAEMLKRGTVADSDLMICEDDIDTKQATIKDLKRCFNGDTSTPSDYKFYSSAKTQDIISGIEVEISHLPSSEKIEDLSQQVKNLVTSVGTTTGTKDPEIVAARGEYDSLANRLDSEQEENDKKYLRSKTVNFSGIHIDLSDFKEAEIKIIALPYDETTTIAVESINEFPHSDIDSELVKKTDTGYKFTYNYKSYNYEVPCPLDAGEYTLYSSFVFSDNFVKDGARLKFNYTDGSSSYIDYGFTRLVRFSIDKPLSSIVFLPNSTLIEDGMWVKINSIMVSEYGNLTEYIKYFKDQYTVNANEEKTFTIDAGRCFIRRSKGIMNISAIDISYNTDDILEDIDILKKEFAFGIDKCGLIEEEGTYIFPESVIENSSNLCVLSKDYDMMRNNQPSLKIKMLNHDLDDQPRFTIILDNTLNLDGKSLISFQFYIDKTLSEYFTSEDGIKIMLSNDYEINNPCANYYFFNIGKDSIVQGWNTVKLRLDKFLPHGSPDISNITQINFRIYSSEFTAGKTMWLNSIIIDQRIKPTILFAFDDFAEDGFDYAYPYLYSRNIPATIFANDKKTLTREYLNKVADLVYLYNWEIGCNGVNPNKEVMLKDDNSREQYMSLRQTREWLLDNFQDSITSYSAPFGNLRPLTMNILKKMGFKLAKEDADNFVSFFSNVDFTIPMHLLSNAEGHGADDICDKIDTIVNTGQVLCIYTGGASRYGTDIEANKISFEKVIDKIVGYMNTGELQCLTFADFYNKCCN